MTDEIDLVVDDPVATITLRRPATLNALTYPMLGPFREAVDAAAADPKVVDIVVTGEGRGFCSGLDASVLQQTAQAGSALLPAARRYVVELAGNVSPASLADTKRLVYEGYGVTYPDALEEIDTVQYAALDRIDAREGAASLIEKRPPVFPRLGDTATRGGAR